MTAQPRALHGPTPEVGNCIVPSLGQGCVARTSTLPDVQNKLWTPLSLKENCLEQEGKPVESFSLPLASRLLCTLCTLLRHTAVLLLDLALYICVDCQACKTVAWGAKRSKNARLHQLLSRSGHLFQDCLLVYGSWAVPIVCMNLELARAVL